MFDVLNLCFLIFVDVLVSFPHVENKITVQALQTFYFLSFSSYFNSTPVFLPFCVAIFCIRITLHIQTALHKSFPHFQIYTLAKQFVLLKNDILIILISASTSTLHLQSVFKLLTYLNIFDLL